MNQPAQELHLAVLREKLHHAPAEIGRVDRRKPVELGLDLVEAGAQPVALDEATSEHFSHVAQILHVSALELGENLRVRIEVTEREPPGTLGKRAPLPPPGRERDEIGRRRELDVDGELLLDLRECAQHLVLLGLELDVDVERRGAPTEQNGRCPAREVAGAFAAGSFAERAHEAANSPLVRELTHPWNPLSRPRARS
jgi:hypothetical protein